MSDTSTSASGFDLRSSADLVAVDVCSVLAAGSPFVPFIGAQPIRLVLTLPLVLFFPGYVLLSALFPSGDGTTDDTRLDGFERVGFSVVASVLVVAAVALGLDGSGVGIRPVPVLFSTAGFTLLVSVAAAARRRPERRSVGFPSPKRTLRRFRIRRAETRLDSVLNVVLVLLLVAALVSIGTALGGLGRTESYTEFYLSTGNSSTAAPSAGVAAPDFDGSIGIENHEHSRVRYTVVVQHQRVRPNDPMSIRTRRTLTTRRVTLDAGDSRTIPYAVPSSVGGPHQRVVFLLYEGAVPPTPTVENADQEIHLWATRTANRSETTRGRG